MEKGVFKGLCSEIEKKDIKKQDNNAILKSRRANIQSARNGYFVDITEDWYYKGDDEKSEYIWVNKPFIAKNMDEVKNILEAEFSEKDIEKPINEVKNIANNGFPKVVSKRDTLIKRNIGFATEEGDGHIHLAFGEIIDKKVGNDIKKVFIGETMPDKVYMNFISGLQDYKGKMIDEVINTLKSHNHKFEIELNDIDKDRSRVFGDTTKTGEHSHRIHIIDLVSTPVSNTPDKV
jgi:hypothetical protein